MTQQLELNKAFAKVLFYLYITEISYCVQSSALYVMRFIGERSSNRTGLFRCPSSFWCLSRRSASLSCLEDSLEYKRYHN